MKDIRIGESLWFEWTGDHYEPDSDADLIYYTRDHVDLDNEIVRRALASTLQRDGVADSLHDGFTMIASGHAKFGYAGMMTGEAELVECDEHGETKYGDIASDAHECTWIEFLNF